MSVFHGWYVPGGMGSGHGSTPAYTTKYRIFLRDFIRRHDVRTVLDWGCGDWQFSKLVDWSGIDYTGVDVVPDLVDRLAREFGQPGRTFVAIDPMSPKLPAGSFDLIVCKDVLQHLPSAHVHQLLALFQAGKHVLLINDRAPVPRGNNGDAKVGGYRCLDPTLPPFSLRGQYVFEFADGGEGKSVFWWQPGR